MNNEKTQLDLISDGIQSESIFNQYMVETILGTLDILSPYTVGRTFRVRSWTSQIGIAMQLDSLIIKEMEIAAILCDIGMWVIPNEIIQKKGRLTLAEFKIVQRHPELSLRALKEISLSPEIEVNILNHHEKYDGTGYPNHLKGKEIPIGAQIINVACTLFALTSERPYQKTFTMDKAVEIIQNEKNKQFPADILDAVKQVHLANGLESIYENQLYDPFAHVKMEIQGKEETLNVKSKLNFKSQYAEETPESKHDDMMVSLRERIKED